MFSGIVAAVGTIERVLPAAGGARIEINAGALDLADVTIGDSIAVGGCCLTVIEKTAATFSADVSAATLGCTVGLNQPGAAVNLEKALRLADRLGGHLVTGHIDGVGQVEQILPRGDNVELSVAAPGELAKYLALKGSVAVDGVSLTINAVRGPSFSVNLIPHTLASTTLRRLTPGARLNLEVDLIARYVERLWSAGTQR